MVDYRRVPAEFDWLAYEMKLVEKCQDLLGREIPDETPMELPIGYKPSPDISELIRELVRGELVRRAAEAEGNESFEEADDFEWEDDGFPDSEYEEHFEPKVARGVPGVQGAASAPADAPDGAVTAPLAEPSSEPKP